MANNYNSNVNCILYIYVYIAFCNSNLFKIKNIDSYKIIFVCSKFCFKKIELTNFEFFMIFESTLYDMKDI